MIVKRLSFKEGGLLKTNIKYSLIGLAVGFLMSAFIHIFTPNGIQAKNVLFNLLFSLLITLSIANVVVLVQCYFTPAKIGFWNFVWVYYLCNLIGLFIGVELTYFIVSIIFNFKYEFITHINDYKFNILITTIVGTLILLYHFQKINAEVLLKAKEMDLVKLNQLKTEAELQALQAKINPHFLYNALNSIASLIHEDADKAESMTIKLSTLFRYSINTMQENYVAIKEEVAILNTYLDIEKVRFGNRINFKIEVNPELKEKLIPRFLLQPLVENALKHGLKDVSDKGEMKVIISQSGNRIEIFIYDNGSPFPEELIAGFGLQNTFDKLQLLYKKDHDIQINNTPQKHIKISIPFI